MSENGNHDRPQKKRKSLLVLVLLLALLLSVTSCIVGYILGKNALSSGGIIDTITITPPEDEMASKPLSFNGKVVYKDGTPYANSRVQLHSDPRETLTDEAGIFFFYNVTLGEHSIAVIDENGKELASVPVKIERNSTGKDTAVQPLSEGGYTLTVAVNIALIEIEIELDNTGKTLKINPGFTTVAYDGEVTTPDGKAEAVDGVIVTPSGAVVLPDHTIVVPKNGVILSDGSYIEADGGVIGPDGKTPEGLNTAPDGTVTLPGGQKVNTDGTVTLPDGIVILPDGRVELPGGTVVTPGQGITSPSNTGNSSGTGNTSGSGNTQASGNTSGGGQLSNPSNPGEGGTPGTPNVPDAPDTPNIPDTPDVPDTPDIPQEPEEKDRPVVLQEGISWLQLSTIDLFKNHNGSTGSYIYPGVSGNYTFSVKNPAGYDVTFDITMAENRKDAIPFEYRLKLGDNYITGDAGSWLTADALQTEKITLKKGTESTYTLEWRWPYESGRDELDTEIGSSADNKHLVTVTLNIVGS